MRLMCCLCSAHEIISGVAFAKRHAQERLGQQVQAFAARWHVGAGCIDIHVNKRSLCSTAPVDSRGAQAPGLTRGPSVGCRRLRSTISTCTMAMARTMHLNTMRPSSSYTVAVLQKVAIYDFDVHHGNGTSDAFEADSSVLYISSHQDGSYPGTGKLSQVGSGDGEGYSINVPLPGDSGDSAYRELWERIVAPALERFQPDIILVSAGAQPSARGLLSCARAVGRSGAAHRAQCCSLRCCAGVLRPREG
jgi:Histone deacetylase domain